MKRSLGRSYRMVAFLLTYFPLCWFFGSPYSAAPAALALLLAVNRVHAKQMRALAARIDAKDSLYWDVEVNQVTVGSISDADYALIRRNVLSDARVYVAQGANLLRVVLNSFDCCYRAIPVGIFWVGVALAIFSPETISDVLAALQHATPSDMRHAVGISGSILVIIMSVSVGVHWMFGLSRFGFVSRFDEAVGTAIRKRLFVAAEGNVLLSRRADGGSGEMDHIRRVVSH